MTEAVVARVADPASWLRGRAYRIARLAGWRRHALAFGAGVLSSLALPPLGLAPLLWLSFPVLLWLLDGARTGRQAFAAGWWFAFGQFLVGWYWISFALFVDIANWWWMLPFALAALPAAMAAYAGLATWASWRLGLSGLAHVLGFAALWGLAEWLRGTLFTGFPWHLIGYAWVGWDGVVQAASVVGVYGLGLLTVAAASLPYLLGLQAPARIAPVAGIVGMVALSFAGDWRMNQGLPAGTAVDGIRLRLVQPNIDQFEKWSPEKRRQHFERLLRLSATDAAGVTHVVWPETAASFYLELDEAARAAVASVTPPGGYVLTGAPRLTMDADGTRRSWNSLVVVDGSGAVVGTYDKAHLVPFGEYVPLADLIPLPSIAGGFASWSAGPGPQTLDLPGLPPFSPLICYEIIFPEEVVADGTRPAWLLNVTNDGWYGETAGPYQHFAISRMRAVEQGMPVVRVANTGISGVVDPYGRVTQALGLGVAGALDVDLPRALPEPTFYATFGNFVLLFMLIIFACAALLLGRGTSRRR